MSTKLKCFFLSFIFFSSFVSAQGIQIEKSNQDTTIQHKITYTPKWEGGLLLGLTAYSGDIEFAFSESRLIGGLFVRRALSNYFAIHLGLSQGGLGGSDSHSTQTPWRVARNFQFKSPLTELTVRGEYHFLGIRRKIAVLSSAALGIEEDSDTKVSMRARRISPFIYVGGGLVRVNPKTNFNDRLQPNPTTAGFRIDVDKFAPYTKTHVIVPFGGGLRIPFIKNQTILTIEGGFRPVFSDKIDGVNISGNPEVNDWYFVSSVGLSKSFGYKKDSDQDGIPDKYDQCPFVKGDEKCQGCPDTDGDGVSDDKDACPTDSGLAIYEGCPDTDGDGIIDKYDDCPKVAGNGQYKGCPTEQKDSTKSSEIATLETVERNDTLNSQSLKLIELTQSATQKDSFINSQTLKPIAEQNPPPQYILEKLTEKPVVAESTNNADNKYLEKATVAELDEGAFNIVRNHYTISPIYFETNKALYRPESFIILDDVAQILKTNKTYKLRITGHTDITGTAAINMALSINRAKMCYKYLIKKGVSAKQMTYKGLGHTQPAADNDTEEARQLNRRVELQINEM